MRLPPLACIQNVVQVGRYSYMLRKMIGASLPGDMTTKLYEHTVAEPGMGMVVVEMKAVTLCGSDKGL